VAFDKKGVAALFSLNRCIASFVIPIVVYLGMKRYLPRHVAAGTGNAIGLVWLHQVIAVVIITWLLGLPLLGSYIGKLMSVYCFPLSVFSKIIGSGKKCELDVAGWSSYNLLVPALIWAFVGCVVGHLIDRLKVKEPIVEAL
jgi:hypothetical protein